MFKLGIVFNIIVFAIIGFYLYLRTDTLVKKQVLSPATSIPTDVEVPVTEHSPTVDEIWDGVNKWRVKNNLPPFIKSERLCDMAKARIFEVKRDWSHDGFYPMNKRFFTNAETGENLARDWKDVDSLIHAWEQSPLHLKNLTYNFKYSCIETDGFNIVQIFANF